MLSPALLVVFVTSSAPAEPTTAAFERSAREVLGTSATLRVERVADPLADSAALDRAGSADGVVELSWNSAAHTAMLHCYIASEQRWLDRAIRFSPADGAADRGRMLGFAVASMFLDAPRFAHARTDEPDSAEAPARQTPSSSPPVETVVTRPRGPSPLQPEAASGAEVTEASALTTKRSPPGAGPNMIEFAGLVATGFGYSSGTEMGALVALGVPLSGPLALRFQLTGRTGELPVAQANVRRVMAGVGLAYNGWSDTDRLVLRLRVDALGNWFQVSHLSSDDVARVDNHGWLVGGDAAATLGYRISAPLTCFASLGLEAMSGQTHVFTHGVERATLPAFRGIGELGFMTHF